MLAALFAGLSNSCFHPITQYVALELSEHREHNGERPPARRRQIKRLAQRDKTDFQSGEFLRGGDPPCSGKSGGRGRQQL